MLDYVYSKASLMAINGQSLIIFNNAFLTGKEAEDFNCGVKNLKICIEVKGSFTSASANLSMKCLFNSTFLMSSGKMRKNGI
jgi:hypothetical protein